MKTLVPQQIALIAFMSLLQPADPNRLMEVPPATERKGIPKDGPPGQLRALAKTSSVPAVLGDTHWGETASGFRMSLILSTNVFLLEEPIRATVVITNTTTNVLSLSAPSDTSIKLSMTDTNGKVVPASPSPPLMTSGPSSVRIPPRDKIVYNIDLTKYLPLTAPGKYNISASRIIHAPPGGTNIPLCSARAQIEIIQ